MKITLVYIILCLGFYTSKGELVRSILYPKSTDFKLYKDGLLMCTISACLGVVTMIYTAIMYTLNQVSLIFNTNNLILCDIK